MPMSRTVARRFRRPPGKHLNLNVRGLGDSATIAINDLSNQLRTHGHRVIKLGLGQSPFPVPEPVVESLRQHAHEKDYLPTAGLPELKEAVADYVRRKHGVERSPEDVLVGPGSKELMFLLQLVFYGDLVIPSPSWVSYAPQARIVGRLVQWLPTRRESGWKVQPEDLEALFASDEERPRILILNYPNNPTGVTYRLDELKAIAEVARRYRVLLLSDEIYGELHHTGHHVSIARFYPEGTIISTGLSKWAGAGGWRLGVFIFPPTLDWLRKAMTAVASETYTSTSAPIQYAAVTAFRGSDAIEDYLHHARRVLRAIGRWSARRLREAGVYLEMPAGGFYLFPDFSPLRDRLMRKGVYTSELLAKRLLEDTGVAALPGSDFGRPPEELTLRLAYVDFDGEAALRAAATHPGGALNGTFLKTYAAPIVNAIESIVDWVKHA